MPGLELVNRLDGLGGPANGTDVCTAGITTGEPAYAHALSGYVPWLLSAEKAIASANGGGSPTHFGYKSNKTDERGAIALAGQATEDQRHAMAIWLPSAINTNAKVIRLGITVLGANLIPEGKTAADMRAVFCGLRMEKEVRKWCLEPLSVGGLVEEGKGAARITAASLGIGASILSGFWVEVVGTLVRLHTPDGVQEHDFSGLANAGSSYGWHAASPGSIAATETAFADIVSWRVKKPAYTPKNDLHEGTQKRVRDLGGEIATVLEWGPGTDARKVGGATTTADPLDIVDGIEQTVAQSFNDGSTQRWEGALHPALDLTDRDLTLETIASAPDQLIYGTVEVENKVTVPAKGTTFTVKVKSTSPFTSGAMTGFGTFYVKSGGKELVFGCKERVGSELKGCELILGEPGEIAAGAALYQHTGEFKSPGVAKVYLAADKAGMDAGNTWEFSAPGFNFGLATMTSWLSNVGKGLPPLARKNGTGCDLTAAGYVKLTFTSAKLPFTGLGEGAYALSAPLSYSGPQLAATPSIKWGRLGTIPHIDAPAFIPSSDDLHISDKEEFYPELQKARPGLPHGGRGTVFGIWQNALEADEGDGTKLTTADLVVLSKAGNELSVHSYHQAAHGSPQTQNFWGLGPGQHYDLVTGGKLDDDGLEMLAALQALGVGGPWTYAMPYGEPIGAGPTLGLIEAGLRAFRSTSGGGAKPIIEGAGAAAKVTGLDLSGISVPYFTEPVGGLNRLCATGTDRDLFEAITPYTSKEGNTLKGCTTDRTGKVPAGTPVKQGNNETTVASEVTLPAIGEAFNLPLTSAGAFTASGKVEIRSPNQGHLFAIEQMRFAARSGAQFMMYTHTMQAAGVPGESSGQWSRDQWAEFLDFVSDLIVGANASGHNPGEEEFPSLRIMPLIEAVTGEPQEGVITEVAMGEAAEEDSAGSVDVEKSVEPGPAMESDAAGSVQSQKDADLGTAQEQDQAEAVDAVKSVEAGTGTEANSAEAVESGKTVELGSAVEEDEVPSVTASLGPGAVLLELNVGPTTTLSLEVVT